MASSNLVANVAPLVQSLQQFTPQAKEDRKFELAGLESQLDLTTAQIENLQARTEEIQSGGEQRQQEFQREQKREQMSALIEENRAEFIKDKNDIAFALKDGPEGLVNALTRLAGEKGTDSQDLAELIDFRNRAVADPDATFKELENNGSLINNQLKTMDEIAGRLKAQQGGTEQQFFESLTEGLSPEDKRRAKDVELRIAPAATGSAIQTITELGTAGAIAATEQEISKGKQTGLLNAQLKIKPQIERAVTLARTAAAAKGEKLTDLARSEAAMPGLLDTVGRLKELSKTATSTIGGSIYDVVAKELGFGSTKGATAKARFIAIINNQVLPLLKPTFGGSFSVQEGESLKATMGDPDASPEQKVAQLESFIDQKVRDVQSIQRELGADDTQPQEVQRLVFDPATGQLVPK